MKARKIRNVRQIEEDVYVCDVELFVESQQNWSKTVYVARKGDESPVNQWILDQLLTGKYKITDQRT